MAIYHLHVKNISRGEGRSAVAAAAYRAGQTLPNDAEEKASAFGGRRGVIHTEIRIPSGAPDWMQDRAALWNRAEAAEHRKDARLAKEIEFALPRELPRQGWIAAARAMADHYVGQGLAVDLAIHEDGTGHNPHVHMMLTTRVAGPGGFGEKLRSADVVAFVREARALWERIANAALAGAGAGSAIDRRSHHAAGLPGKPSSHRGPDAAERRRRRQEAVLAGSRATDEQPIRLPPAESRPIRAEPVSQDRADAELPVPDPEGRPISLQEQDAAERAMLEEMERNDIDRATQWWLDGNPGEGQATAPEERDRPSWWERDR